MHKKQKVNHSNQHGQPLSKQQNEPGKQQQPRQHQHQQQHLQTKQHQSDQAGKQQQKQPGQSYPAAHKQQQEQPKQKQQQQQKPQQQDRRTGKKRKRPNKPHGSAAAAANGMQPAPVAAAAAGAAAATTADPAAATVSGTVAPLKPWHPGSATAISSNWQALQQQLKAAAATAKPPFRRKRKDTDGDAGAAGASGSKGPKKQISSMGRNTALTHVVAMDCEMVGVGPQADRDSLARVSIVSAAGLGWDRGGLLLCSVGVSTQHAHEQVVAGLQLYGSGRTS
jgi:hypothetical protein